MMKMVTAKTAEIYGAAGIRSLPADPLEAARAVGIRTINYKNATKYLTVGKQELYRDTPMGFSFIIRGEPCIALNENLCGEYRRRFTAAHELGHCLLGHLRNEVLTAAEERAADSFAAEFLAPLAVLSECGVRSAGELARLCGLSGQAAGIRLKYLAEYEACDGSPSADERKILSMFEDFIRKYKESGARHCFR